MTTTTAKLHQNAVPAAGWRATTAWEPFSSLGLASTCHFAISTAPTQRHFFGEFLLGTVPLVPSLARSHSSTRHNCSQPILGASMRVFHSDASPLMQCTLNLAGSRAQNQPTLSVVSCSHCQYFYFVSLATFWHNSHCKTQKLQLHAPATLRLPTVGPRRGEATRAKSLLPADKVRERARPDRCPRADWFFWKRSEPHLPYRSVSFRAGLFITLAWNVSLVGALSRNHVNGEYKQTVDARVRIPTDVLDVKEATLSFERPLASLRRLPKREKALQFTVVLNRAVPGSFLSNAFFATLRIPRDSQRAAASPSSRSFVWLRALRKRTLCFFKFVERTQFETWQRCDAGVVLVVRWV